MWEIVWLRSLGVAAGFFEGAHAGGLMCLHADRGGKNISGASRCWCGQGSSQLQLWHRTGDHGRLLVVALSRPAPVGVVRAECCVVKLTYWSIASGVNMEGEAGRIHLPVPPSPTPPPDLKHGD